MFSCNPGFVSCDSCRQVALKNCRMVEVWPLYVKLSGVSATEQLSRSPQELSQPKYAASWSTVNVARQIVIWAVAGVAANRWSAPISSARTGRKRERRARWRPGRNSGGEEVTGYADRLAACGVHCVNERRRDVGGLHALSLVKAGRAGALLRPCALHRVYPSLRVNSYPAAWSDRLPAAGPSAASSKCHAVRAHTDAVSGGCERMANNFSPTVSPAGKTVNVHKVGRYAVCRVKRGRCQRPA